MSDPGSASPLPETAVKSLSTVPAYALVVVILIVLVGAAVQVSTAVLVIIAVTALILSVYVIWVIDSRAKHSVSTDSVQQAERLEEVRARDTPAHAVLETLVGDGEVRFVYSSTEQREFVNQLGETVRPEDVTYGSGEEKWATTIPDAVGAGRIRGLLYAANKRDKVDSITSWPDSFRPDDWERSLVILGSGKSNRVTTRALADHDVPYRFSEDFNAILDRSGRRFPENQESLRTCDYGILVKVKVEREDGTSVYLIVAGVGPYGTLAACKFLDTKLAVIHAKYGREPFAYLLSVKRNDLKFEPEVVADCGLPVSRG